MAKKIFPFSFKPHQERSLEELVQHPHVLWQAPTGFGKTLLALASMLPQLLDPTHSLKKIIVFVRMKTQIFRILEESHRLGSAFSDNMEEIAEVLQLPIYKNKVNIPFIALPLLGKEELCVNKVRFSKVKIDCNAIDCSKRNLDPPSLDVINQIKNHFYFEEPRTTETIRDTIIDLPGSSSHCPYFVLKQMINNAEIIITTHAWLQNATLRSILDELILKNPSSTSIILDEVHNFKSSRIASVKINELEKVINYTNYKLSSRKFLTELFNYIKINKRGHVPPFIQENNRWYLQQLTIDYNSLLNRIWDHNEIIPLVMNIKSFLEAMGDLWYIDLVINEKTSKLEKELIRINPFPSKIVGSLHNFNRTLFMSGTLYPVNAYKVLYNLNENYKILVVPTESMNIQHFILNIPSITSRFRNRNKRLFAILAIICLDLHSTNPGHTLVFNTSKKFTDQLYSALRCLAKRYGVKEIFKEGTSAYSQSLLDSLRVLDHELIIATMGGGFSEGVEIKHPKTGRSLINLIIMTGIPHPPPTLENEILMKLYKIVFGSKMASVLLNYLSIYQLIQQAAGRGIRSPEDYCSIVCTDNRLISLNIWSIAKRIENINQIKKDLKKFYFRMK
ncbi:MAG: helicase C-terminal domain-containing protein [Candidatus Hodarchaeales archaeon]